MFNPNKEACPAKLNARDIRIGLTKAFLDYLKPSELDLYSLPGFGGEYERTIYRHLRSRNVKFHWSAYESLRNRFRRDFNPFGTFTLKDESNRVRSARIGGNSLAYANFKLSVEPGRRPAIIDADFCGYPTEDALNSIRWAPDGSLLMLTLWTGWRGWTVGNGLESGIRYAVLQAYPWIGQKVSSSKIASIFSDRIQSLFRATLVRRHDYLNNGAEGAGQGAPMVLLVYHLEKHSSFKYYLDNMKTKTDEIALKKNMARVLVSSGRFANTEIDAALKLKPFTSAGLDAAANRYGRSSIMKFDK